MKQILVSMHISVHLDIKYDAEKDAKQKFEAKQRTLQRVEDAKKKEAEQGKGWWQNMIKQGHFSDVM